MLNFAIIGLGNIATVHANAIRDIEDARLYAICSSSQDKIDRFCNEYSIEKVFSDVDEMLKCNGIDVVCILTPSGMHADIGVKVANSGKHVIVEKPIDISLEKTDMLIEACKKNNVGLGVISQHRMDSATIKVKEAVDKGYLGKLINGTAHIKWFRSQEYYDSGKWRGTWQLDGGGALMNQGIHTIDFLLHIMGDVKSVNAICKTLGHDNIEVEDIAGAIVEFKNGAIGSIIGSTATYPGLPARLEICGLDGSAIIEGDKLTYFECKDNKMGYDIDDSKSKTGASNPTDIDYIPHMLQLKEVIHSINNKLPIPNDGVQGRKALELTLAIYRSSDEKKTIYFD